ncbi:hypothetical protein RvVAT039_00890 [Agrobacterium vitis]|uniref:hypothetical protein n=1 Tax=Agrobacterium vitis TaxID=373 RepID=UPI0015DAFD7F|nr:hypothetical protein [Agrobacterium vitis]BCH62873.1 hypothetical protein RvVAT039_00890 [Agrobacterium vitis]
MSASSESKFKYEVIEGGGRKPSAWIDLPQTVIGISPFKKNETLVYRLATEGPRKALEYGHRQSLLDLWSFVLGTIPPLNSAKTKWGDYNSVLTSLGGAHACFRGIKRPVGDDDQGFDVFAFVVNPVVTFRYAPSMACLIEPVKIPDDIVGVIYIKLDYPDGRRPRIGASSPISRGTVTHWELVEADVEKCLPVEWESRYRKRMW